MTKLPNYQITKLPNYPTTKLSNYHPTNTKILRSPGNHCVVCTDKDLRGANDANNTIDPSTVDLSLRAQWCNGELNTCGTLCSGDSDSNTCDPATLNYTCTCSSNGSTPGLQYYTQTMPTFICEKIYQDCIAAGENDAAAQKLCTQAETKNCGKLDPDNATASAATSSAAASALNIGREYGTGIFAAGVLVIDLLNRVMIYNKEFRGFIWDVCLARAGDNMKQTPIARCYTPSFGVEFEFLIAVLENPRISNPNPRDPRNVYFPPTEHDAAPSYFTLPAGKEDWANEWSIYAHIKTHTLLHRTPHRTRKSARSNFSMWEITRDGSIQPPQAPPHKFKKAYSDWQTYTFVPVEVRTPAYYYTEDALRDVGDFCKIMRKILPHHAQRKLRPARPHRLESLHPEHRIDDRNLHCSSFRRSTYWQWRFREDHERPAAVLESMAFLMGCETRDAFCEAVHSEGSKGVFSYMGGSAAWKFESMGTESRGGAVGVPNTIECRQHAGSLDPDEVASWVRTVVGLVHYARKVDAYEFREVLWRVKGEKWVMGCPSVREVEKRRYLPRATLYRPVFGEQWCGVVQLLRILGLRVPAAFYEERLGRWMVDGVYRHWYNDAPKEYLVAGEEGKNDGAGDEDEGDDNPLSNSLGSSDSRFGPFGPNPRTPDKKEDEKGEREEEKKEEKHPSMDLKYLGIDTLFSNISSAEEQKRKEKQVEEKAEEKQPSSREEEKKSSSPEDFPMRPGATKLQGQNKTPHSSSSEDFPVHTDAKKLEGVGRPEGFDEGDGEEQEVSEHSSLEPMHSEGMSEHSRGSMTLTFEDKGPNTMEDSPWGSFGEGEGEKADDDVVEEREAKEKESKNDKKKRSPLKYLRPLTHTPLPPLAFPSNYEERTPNQHSYLLNGTTPAEIEALAPNTENYRGSLLHRRDRQPSSPWLSQAPNIASLPPNRKPYPGPLPWMGWEWHPVDNPTAIFYPYRAQLADALEEGTIGQAWVMDHQMPANREEGIKTMLQGLQLDQVSPSLQPFLQARNYQLGRVDDALLYNMFPAPASDPTQFEKQDDEWWRFEVAGATVEELQARLAHNDLQVVRHAREKLLRIGGDDGSGDEYWPEGARNPFGGADRFQQPVVEDVSPGAPNSPNHRFPVGYRFTEGFQGPEDHEAQASFEARERKSPPRVVEGSLLARQIFHRWDNEPSSPSIHENKPRRLRNAVVLVSRGGEVVGDDQISWATGKYS
ncbi:hypothetical protein DID88_001209 [Monilinia fructigena]|uniref:DUF7707 domain-containing protein n=1 Tax=Monilinia fructigena TaxID=38457 RepID=A0A395J094_9HELO|nr:hypothetical protein DID88_001209 [Monilinia fructigena]